MVDIHSHFLPGIDDGAKNVRISIDMLKDSKKQGVSTVLATPHFHPKAHSIENFIAKRQTSWERLKAITDENGIAIPDVVLGAEVKLGYSLLELESIDDLLIENTEYILLELPFEKWSPAICDLLYSVMTKFKVKPILAHIERYRKSNPDFEIYKEFHNMGAQMQINADSFLKFFSKKIIRTLFENNMIQLIGSDMHNMDERKSHISEAFIKIQKLFGNEFAESLNKNAEKIIKG